MKKKLLDLKNHRQLATIAIDAGFIILAWLSAFILRVNLGLLPDLYLKGMLLTLPIVLVCQVIINCWFGLHRGSWRFCSMNDLTKIVKAALVGVFFSIGILFLTEKVALVPRSIPFIYSLLLIFFLGGVRFSYRKFHEHSQQSEAQKRVLVIGAGAAGESLVRDLLRNKITGYLPVAFVDDSPAKIGREIHGLKVHGDLSKISSLVQHFNIELIIIAMPSATSQQMQRVVNLCEKVSIPFRIVPSVSDLASGRVSLDSLRNVSLEDLLGREQVKLDWENIAACVKDHVILVSGGAGSIGSELCRQIARFSPKQVLVVDNNEFNLYSIDMELAKNKDLSYLPVLMDVTDRDGVKELMQKHRPHIVFHVAAYKHVPLLEKQVRCAMRNNVLGTQVLAEEASQVGVAKFIMVSTDKAVRPTNIMGATKRIAEVFCQNFDRISKTQFITVRFGNVLGSAGSVVPLFKKQLKQGGPITVTHPEVTRYFMTIQEATQLILQATTLGEGGEIFVLDMGQPIKIQYLAEQIIQLAGLKVGKDIEISYTGLRPGEKLHEELFHESEALLPTPHDKISLAKATVVDWNELQQNVESIKKACVISDELTLKAILKSLVPEYHNDFDELEANGQSIEVKAKITS